MKNKAKVMQLIGLALMMPDCGLNIHPMKMITVEFNTANMSGCCIIWIEDDNLSGDCSGTYYYTAEEAIELLSFIANNPRVS